MEIGVGRAVAVRQSIALTPLAKDMTSVTIGVAWTPLLGGISRISLVDAPSDATNN